MNRSQSNRRKDPVVAGILAWLVPGLGHWYIGQRGKAVLFALLLISTFLAGLSLGHFRNVYFDLKRLPTYGQLGGGILALTPMALVSPASAPTGPSDNLIPTFDVGTYYTCVAALLNWLVMFNAITMASPYLKKHRTS